MARKVLFFTLLVLSGATLPGCIVQEIRDELVSANTQLAGVQEKLGQLEATNATLEATKAELATTNALIKNVSGGLTEIDTGLNRIDSTNTSLTTLEKQLTTLDSMNRSMVRLDGHLSSLRTTITKLDTALPFFDLGGTGETIDSPPEQLPAASTQAAASAEETTPSAQQDVSSGSAPLTPPTPVASTQPGGENAAATSTSPGAQKATSSKPDSIIGIWLSAYPDRGAALVLLPTHRYHLGKPQGQNVNILGSVGRDNPSRIETGTWKREDKAIIFTPDPYETSGPNNTTQTITPKPWQLTVLTQLGRSATTHIEDVLVVWNRP